MPNTVTLVRHDGSLMDATPEQAQRLQLLGYKEITPEQNNARLQQEAATDYYTSPGQETLATGEGIASGLTFGASDYWAGLWGNDEPKARAQYNPGTRMASEVVGALLPAFLTGGASAAESFGVSGARAAEEAGALSKLASYAPTNLLTKAARALAPEESLAGAISRGIIEGGVYGGTGAADHAYLDGEPITAETVLHGIGIGALLGGAIGGIGHAVTVGGEAAAEAKAAELRAQEPVPKGSLNAMAGSEYSALRDEIANLGAKAKEVAEIADASVKDVTATLKKANTGYDAIKNFIDKSPEAAPEHMQNLPANFEREVGKMQSLYDKASKAVEAGRFNQVDKLIADYSTHAKSIADRLGIEVPDPAKSLKDLAQVRSVSLILRDMPKTVEGFASLSAKKLEALSAAIETAKGLPITNGVQQASDNFVKAMAVDSASGDVLRAAQKTAKGVFNSEGKVPKVATEPKKVGLVRKVASYALGGKAWLAAKSVGMGRAGSYAAYRGTRDMVMHGTEHFAGMKAAALHGIREAAAAWGPNMGQAVTRSAGASAPALAYTLFGEPDKGTSDKQELAKRRVQELYSFAPIASDAVYKAVEPLSATQPLLAPSIHKTAMQAIQAMLAMAPKDPGAMSRLKSLWQPSPVQAEILNKQLAVFHDPVGEAVAMLRSGNLDVTKLSAMKQIAPATFDELRLAMMGRLSEPKVLDKLSYQDQIFISVSLGIPLHTSATPAYIATSQQMHLDRNQPLKANPRIGPSGGLPNPSDNNYASGSQGLATESQKSTER